ncbi:MAG: Ig-like domain-containing protein [Paludibacteraceae bacterium]|nr:Ig-like domain-containing protein [Paludibacteraceae bacterium]
MKKLKLFNLLPLLAMVVFFSCKENGSIKIESSISLEQKEVVMNPGGTTKLKAKLMQIVDGDRVSTGDDVSLTWTSSNDSIATVSYGVVTAVTGGEVDIIVSAANVDNVQEQRCRVVVRDIYVSGECGDNVTKTACVWKNNKLFYSLASDANAFANAMVVTDNKEVYVAGSVASVGKVWKNGVEVLSLGDTLKSIAVEEGDVYVAGSEGTTAKVWKNGNELYSVPNALFKSIVVNAGTVYVGGVLDGSATIWTDNVATTLANGVVNGLYIDGADVYAAGECETYGKVWKNNNELYVFEKNTVATSVAVANNKVYACGYSGTTQAVKAKVWENGVQLGTADKEYLGEFVVGKDADGVEQYVYTELGNNGKVKASTIYLSLDDVYVSGYFDNTQTNAVYWKNGTSQKLEGDNAGEKIMSPYSPGKNRARATAIVVK